MVLVGDNKTTKLSNYPKSHLDLVLGQL
jgi:hypothetical protein